MATDDYQRRRPVLGVFCFTAAGFGLSTAIWGQASEPTHRAVVVFGAIVFLIAGLLLSFRPLARVTEWGIVILLLCFTIIGGWISLFAPAKFFAEGSAAPSLADVAISRTLFGFGATLTSAVVVGMLYQIFTRK